MSKKIIKKIEFRPMTKIDIKFCIAMINNAFLKNIKGHNYFENTDLSRPPWSWFENEQIYFYVLSINEQIIGYVIWRAMDRLSHLHSFLISATHQRQGFGSKMLSLYEEKAMSNNVDIQLYTLHTYEKTAYNHLFYLENGYKRYKYNDEKKFEVLQLWIENCSKHNDWPLSNGKILFYKSLKT